MSRYKRTLIIFLFTISFIVIALIGLLVPFFEYEKSFIVKLNDFSTNISEVITTDNLDDLISFYEDDNSNDIIVFNSSGTIVGATSDSSLETNYLFKLKNKLGVINPIDLNGNGGLSTCSSNTDNSLYILSVIYYDNGQETLAIILDTLFASNPNVERRIEFDHTKKRLFQVSDMLTVIDKLDYKRKNNIPFTKAETFFFRGKDFRHIINLLKNKRI